MASIIDVQNCIKSIILILLKICDQDHAPLAIVIIKINNQIKLKL